MDYNTDLEKRIEFLEEQLSNSYSEVEKLKSDSDTYYLIEVANSNKEKIKKEKLGLVFRNPIDCVEWIVTLNGARKESSACSTRRSIFTSNKLIIEIYKCRYYGSEIGYSQVYLDHEHIKEYIATVVLTKFATSFEIKTNPIRTSLGEIYPNQEFIELLKATIITG